MSKQTNRVRKPCPNYVPPAVASSFQKELSTLVDVLSIEEGFKGRYLKSEYMSKYNGPGSTSASDRRSAAVTKWLQTEVRNESTNSRIQLGMQDFGWTSSDKLLTRVRHIVKSILGPLDTDILSRGLMHSNGASTRVRRSPVAAIKKHSGIAHVSSSALKHWFQVASCTLLSNQPLLVQESSVLFTVPKNSEIDRPACKEPEINMLLQRSVGKHIRSRLRKVAGIDLRDQTRNQYLAKVAIDQRLATIDLSAASDSITRQFVFECLPFDWWSLLDDLRVHSTIVDGEEHVLEMFSSMGNGFTFELESLLFYALVRAVCWESGIKGTISVYGDDIICPCKISRRLVRVFAWFGFKVNAKKSFWSGPFRESCGKHYWNGLDVTPFYVRGPIRWKTDIIRILNRLLQWDGRDTMCLWHADVVSFHRKWAQHLPRELWGGVDPEFDGALVTGDKPCKRLIPSTTKVLFESQAGLNKWLTDKECIYEIDALFFDPSREVQRVISSFPPGTMNTAWDPYVIYGSDAVLHTQ